MAEMYTPAPASAPKETVLGYVEAWRWWPIRSIFVEGGIPAYRDPIASAIQWVPFADSRSIAWNWSDENVADSCPTIDNTSGFYAYDLNNIEDHTSCHLFGRVALYGDVVHHKFGYRAEKARILDVWVDKDFIRVRPDAWELIRDIPQVKGVYDTCNPTIYNSNGEIGAHQCLILEHQKELSGTSLSDGQMNGLSTPNQTTTMIVIDRRQSSSPTYQFGFTGWQTVGSQCYPKAPSSLVGDLVDLYGSKVWVHRPEGRVCEYCDRLIADHEPVAVSYALPDDHMQRIHDHTFEWKQNHVHMSCLVEAIKPLTLSGFTWDSVWGTTTWPTYGGIARDSSATFASNVWDAAAVSCDRATSALQAVALNSLKGL